MKKLIYVVLITCNIGVAQQSFYSVTAGNGNGLRFWNDDSYKIHMGTGSEYFFGPVQDYSIKMNMNGGTPNRGWTWGVAGQTPVVAISAIGNMQIAGSFNASGSVGVGTATPRGQLDVAGIGDIYLSNNPIAGTGQSIYLPGHVYLAPFSGTDWTFLQARRSNDSGSTNLMLRTWNAGALTDAIAITSIGRVGIGTASPQLKLHVKGGGIMSTDPSFESISVKMDGNSVPALRFTRWTGVSSHQHNAFIGQFSNSALGEYSFAIGTGFSAAGDQNFNNNIITATLAGNVGIGTPDPKGFKLAVEGKIWAKEVQVALTNPGPDYVFEKDYKLLSLEETKAYIDANKHLPEVPSAKEMEKNGVQLGEMNMLLLKKVEELTLYIIEQEKRIQKLENKN